MLAYAASKEKDGSPLRSSPHFLFSRQFVLEHDSTGTPELMQERMVSALFIVRVGLYSMKDGQIGRCLSIE